MFCFFFLITSRYWELWQNWNNKFIHTSKNLKAKNKRKICRKDNLKISRKTYKVDITTKYVLNGNYFCFTGLFATHTFWGLFCVSKSLIATFTCCFIRCSLYLYNHSLQLTVSMHNFSHPLPPSMVRNCTRPYYYHLVDTPVNCEFFQGQFCLNLVF